MYRLIAFEGISGAGKTTLYEAVRPYIGQTNMLVHRFTPTMWVYDRLYGRNKVDTPALINLERQTKVILRPLIVWTICDPEVAETRKVEQGDLNVEPDLMRAQTLYWVYFNNYCQFEVLRVRTDQQSVDESAWEIMSKVVHNA